MAETQSLAPPRRHDPRIDPPTKADRRRAGWWVLVLAFTPICLGVLVWATVNWNGSYPNVKAPVPHGWQEVPGIYASFSVPSTWSLQPFLSDPSADVYYSGPAGGIGESVTQADKEPSSTGRLPAVVGTFLTESYRVASVTPFRLRNAACGLALPVPPGERDERNRHPRLGQRDAVGGVAHSGTRDGHGGRGAVDPDPCSLAHKPCNTL
jgi:hypothetical protein